MLITLKTARRIAQLSQVQLAKKARVTQSTICQLEKGLIVRPSYEVVGRIARALNVSAEELFPLSDDDDAVAS